MAILALDTSTLCGSVAIVDTDGRVRAMRGSDSTAPSDRIVALCAEVLLEAGLKAAALDAIAVGAGPGSFTGLRIGLASAKGLAYAIGKPLWLASSLAALSYDLDDVDDGTTIVATLDARRGEIYVGPSRKVGPRREAIAPERVVAPSELAAIVAALPGPIAIVGDAIAAFPDAFRDLPSTVAVRTEARPTPSAQGVARAALASDRRDRLHDGAPTYIRPSEAEVMYPDGVPGAWRRPAS